MFRTEAALQWLTVRDGIVFCEDDTPFDRVAYSRFKHGYTIPALKYGYGLARLIGDKLQLAAIWMGGVRSATA